MDYNVVRSGTVYKNMRDPDMIKYYYKFKTVSQIKNNEIYGSSPTDIFVGRFGYPNVYVGPLVPPQLGDTTVMGTPEMWVGKTIPEIVEYRSLLVRGMYKTKISNADHGKVESMLTELAIADKYLGVNEQLTHAPSLRLSFSENSQPFGPSAKLKGMSIENTKANPNIEKAYFDTSMKASDAIIELYDKGLMVSKIQKALAVGALGMGKNRKFVPTRWSITAVDDTLGKHKLKTIKETEPIDTIRVYEQVGLDNRWLVVMLPGTWEYELVEAWYPGTTWNENNKNIEIFSSYEPFTGRSKYAEIGGCYYAARLASAELLEKMDRQAKVAILREAHPGYIMPVGVWNVREHVRAALKTTPKEFANMDQLFAFISSKMDIPVPTWLKNSTLLRRNLYQRRLA